MVFVLTESSAFIKQLLSLALTAPILTLKKEKLGISKTI